MTIRYHLVMICAYFLCNFFIEGRGKIMKIRAEPLAN